VLVHMNNQENKSYLLDFEKKITKQDLMKLLEGDKKNGVDSLLGYADAFLTPVQRVEVSPEGRQRALFDADLIVSQGYTSERLA
jgi:hypothetical protein